ncbi:hypothetical protein MP228_010302 [Amoeboaphelidium protococcarum]|nr:hypothetical protein MP228_010302 [Amoeboaphelidium protococcarum]
MKYFALFLIVLYLTKPNIDEFMAATKANTAGWQVASPMTTRNQLEYRDLLVVSAMKVNNQRFVKDEWYLGALKLWIPLPYAAADQVLQYPLLSRCNYRGVNLGNNCLCLPSYSASSQCKKLSRFVSLYHHLPKSLRPSKKDKFGYYQLLREVSVLELILSVSVCGYVFGSLFGGGFMYRHFTLSWYSLRRWRVWTIFTWPFNHASLFNLAWTVYLIYSVSVTNYQTLGDKNFGKALLCVWFSMTILSVFYGCVISRNHNLASMSLILVAVAIYAGIRNLRLDDLYRRGYDLQFTQSEIFIFRLVAYQLIYDVFVNASLSLVTLIWPVASAVVCQVFII